MTDHLYRILNILESKNSDGRLDIPIVMLKELINTKEPIHKIRICHSDEAYVSEVQVYVNEEKIIDAMGRDAKADIEALSKALGVMSNVEWREEN